MIPFIQTDGIEKNSEKQRVLFLKKLENHLETIHANA